MEWAGYSVAVENAHERVRRSPTGSARPRPRRASRRCSKRLYIHGRDRPPRSTRPTRTPSAPRSPARARPSTFDALLAADERWRALVPKVDELRGRQKLKGKPTPEQLEELGAREGGAARRRGRARRGRGRARRAARRSCRTRPTRRRPTATPTRTPSRAAPRRRPDAGRPRAHRGRPLRDGARGARSRARASATSSATRRCSRSRSTASRSTAAAAHGHVPMLPPVLVREEAMYGTGFFPTERSNIYALESDELYLTGTSEVALAGLPHGRDPRGAAAPLRRVLDVLPPRGGRRRQGHARHVPRAPVQQGRAVRLLRARAARTRSTTGCSRSRRSSCRRSTCRTASSTSPPATSARSASKKYDIEAWFPSQQRYREITSTSNTTDFQARRLGIRYRVGEKQLETPHTLNGTAVTDRWLLAVLENFGGDVPEVLHGLRRARARDGVGVRQTRFVGVPLAAALVVLAAGCGGGAARASVGTIAFTTTRDGNAEVYTVLSDAAGPREHARATLPRTASRRGRPTARSSRSSARAAATARPPTST